ncbi:MAG: Holliday junction resolvase RuvX [Epsilonproteobacteria bacterium]|nr:Holliday junction resolvase RuvX [Campylobacterota bacterium]
MLASLDIGLKRIGIALSLDGKVVLPSSPIIRKNRNQAAKEVSDFLRDNRVDTLVVGLPKGGSSEKEMQRRVKHFVSLLDFEGDIFYQDEYGSSKEAEDLTKGVIKHKRDGKIDSVAASVILQRWVASNHD